MPLRTLQVASRFTRTLVKHLAITSWLLSELTMSSLKEPAWMRRQLGSWGEQLQGAHAGSIRGSGPAQRCARATSGPPCLQAPQLNSFLSAHLPAVHWAETQVDRARPQKASSARLAALRRRGAAIAAARTVGCLQPLQGAG